MVIPSINIKRACRYLSTKGVKQAYMFGSGLKTKDPSHDLDIAVDVPPTEENKAKFEDATDYGIDLFLLGPIDELFSTGLDDWLYTNKGWMQDLETVKAKKFRCK